MYLKEQIFKIYCVEASWTHSSQRFHKPIRSLKLVGAKYLIVRINLTAKLNNLIAGMQNEKEEERLLEMKKYVRMGCTFDENYQVDGYKICVLNMVVEMPEHSAF